MIDPALQANRYTERFSQNAFRILGLPGDADQADIQEASATIRRAIKLGVEKSTPWDFLQLGPLSSTDESVRNALGRLASPQQRLRERLFWFIQKEVCIVLKDLSFGPKHSEIPKSHLSLLPGGAHDFAVLEFLSTVTADPQLRNHDQWASMLHLWSSYVSGEAYWLYFKEIELRGGFEPAASEEEFQIGRAEAGRFVADIVASIARNAVSQGDIPLFQRAFDFLQSADLDKRILPEIEDDLLGPMEDEIEALCKDIRNESNEQIQHDSASPQKNKRICEAAVDRLRKELEPRYAKLLNLCGKESVIGGRIAVAVAECLWGLAVDHTWADEFIAAEKLGLDAREMAPQGTVVAGQIEKSLQGIMENASKERIGKNLKPIDSTPALGTLNGFGCRIYGRTDEDPLTQSYLTTYYLTALFIPIIPIGRYRVKDAPEGGWYFLGKAPLRKIDRWHLGLVLASILLFAIFVSLPSDTSSGYSGSSSYSEPANDPPTSANASSTQSDSRKQQMDSIEQKITIYKAEIDGLRSDRNALLMQHNQLKAKLDQYESQLRACRKQLDGGIDVRDEERTLVRRHNDLIPLYNRQARRANRIATKLKAAIKRHNELVQKYNSLRSDTGGD